MAKGTKASQPGWLTSCSLHTVTASRGTIEAKISTIKMSVPKKGMIFKKAAAINKTKKHKIREKYSCLVALPLKLA